MGLLFFQPIYQERVWGGHNLSVKLGRTLPDNTLVGESWEIVDRPNDQSIVAFGPWEGRSLRELLSKHPTHLMGPHWASDKPFPILVKWLDCQKRLSLQVHPPAKVAAALGGEPKTEHWYVAEASENAALIVGHKPGISRAAFEQAIYNNTLDTCVKPTPVKTGDSLLIESGCLHAIDAGCLILEIQQNSDTTYRVYDWGRLGLDGNPRTLHVKEALASIQFEAPRPLIISKAPGNQLLAECKHFRIRKEERTIGETFSFEACQEPRILSILQGTLKSEGDLLSLRSGSNVFLPYGDSFSFHVEEPVTFLITDHFSH